MILVSYLAMGFLALASCGDKNDVAPAKIIFTNPALSINDIECGKLTITTANDKGEEMAGGGSTAITMSSTSTSAVFYIDAGCTDSAMDTEFDYHQTIYGGKKSVDIYVNDRTAGSFLLTAKANYDGTSITEATQEFTNTSGIVGTWVRSCFLGEGDSDYSKTTTVFEKDGTFYQVNHKYDDSSCTTSALSYTKFSGTYKLGEEGSFFNSSLLRKLDTSITKVYIAALSDNAVSSSNSNRTCDFSNWAAGSEVDCTSTYLGTTTPTYYNLVRYSSKEMVVGKASSEETSRPTNTETAYTHIRQ